MVVAAACCGGCLAASEWELPPGCLDAPMKKLMKCDMMVQTADALGNTEYVLDAVPHQEVA